MKVSTDLRVGRDVNAPGFLPRLYEAWREITQKVNGLAAGDIGAADDTGAAPPVGNYLQGKFVRNSAPVELGTAGSKYVVIGWVCTTSGNPATFKECRHLTGG